MHHKPNKGLSQVFLVRAQYLERIASYVEHAALMLEIGPGRGELTRYLIPKAKTLLLVEVDASLAAVLKKQYADQTRISVIEKDIMSFDLGAYASSEKKISIVGNLPYHLSFSLIEYFAAWRDRIASVHASFQKEFAQKLIARAGTKDYSFITCVFQYYFKEMGHFVIPREAFYPVPKIDTMFLKFVPHDEYRHSSEETGFLFGLIRTAFSYRRKKIDNALRQVFDKDRVSLSLAACGIDPSARPDDISLASYVKLASALKT